MDLAMSHFDSKKVSNNAWNGDCKKGTNSWIDFAPQNVNLKERKLYTLKRMCEFIRMIFHYHPPLP